jgi:hypothetical protein
MWLRRHTSSSTRNFLILGEGFLAFVIRVRDLSPYSLLGNRSFEKSVPTGNDQITTSLAAYLQSNNLKNECCHFSFVETDLLD